MDDKNKEEPEINFQDNIYALALLSMFLVFSQPDEDKEEK